MRASVRKEHLDQFSLVLKRIPLLCICVFEYSLVKQTNSRIVGGDMYFSAQ